MPSVESNPSANPDRAVIVDSKKFLWDGLFFDTREDASQQAEAYKNDSFEVHLVEKGEKHVLYTRRAVVKEVITAP